MVKKVLIFFTLIILFYNIEYVKAFSVDNKNIEMEKGKTSEIDLYVDVPEDTYKVEFSLTFSSWDITADFASSGDFSHKVTGVTHIITSDTSLEGKIKVGKIKINTKSNPTELNGTININKAIAYNSEEEETNLNLLNINVKIINNNNDNNIDEKTDTNKNYINKINSNIVKIELKENIYEYEVKVDSSVTELDLEVETIDPKYKAEIVTQKLEELEDNTIEIKITENNETLETYKIKVIKKNQTNEQVVEIDNSKFIEKTNFRSKWIVALVIFIPILILGVFLLKREN